MEKFPVKFNDQYEITGQLGKGGMGYVYKALDRKLNREVAFKILDKGSQQEDEASVKRFKQEAQALKSLNHQNIVQLYDFGREGNYLYLSMTLATGITLSELLKKRGSLDFKETINISKQICRGLKYAHNLQIVHRDIKPSNIMVTEDDIVYLMDFGISLMQNSERLTSTGMAMGTPEYMSPEQYRGFDSTNKTDIYGLGIVMYEMICGRPPFTGKSAIALANKHTNEKPEPPINTSPEIPKKLNDTILKCLEKDPAKRYQDIADLLNDLDRIDSESNTVTVETSEKVPMINKKSNNISPKVLKMTLVAALLICITIVIGTIAILNQIKSINPGMKLINPTMIEAEFIDNGLEGEMGPQNYPGSNLFDNNLSTAWIPPENSNTLRAQIRLAKPTVITSIGIATGYQKELDDSFKDRFTIFHKPKEILIINNNKVSRRLTLKNIRGVQYFSLDPFETQQFTVQIKDSYNTNETVPIAVSEIRLIGLELTNPN